MIVVPDVPANQSQNLVQGLGAGRPDRLDLDCLVPSLDFAVGLWVVGRGADMGHAGLANEDLGILGQELRPNVGEHARTGRGMLDMLRKPRLVLTH